MEINWIQLDSIELTRNPMTRFSHTFATDFNSEPVVAAARLTNR